MMHGKELLIFSLVILVTFQHLFFLVLEVFLWDRSFGIKAFRMTPEFAKLTKSLAINQGFYNGFLAVALAIAVWKQGTPVGDLFRLYGLSCVVIAAIIGGLTVSKRILWIQGLPAGLALVLVLT